MKIEIKKYPTILVSLLTLWLIYNSGNLLYRSITGATTTSTIAIILNIISFIMFGTMLVINILRITDRKSGIELTDEGINFRPSRTQKAKVSWNDIIRIDYTVTRNRKRIVPILKYPEDVIAQQTNWFGRSIMKSLYKKFGSPVVILMENYSTDIQMIKTYLDSKEVRTVDTVAQN